MKYRGWGFVCVVVGALMVWAGEAGAAEGGAAGTIRPTPEQVDKLIHDLQQKILSYQTNQAVLVLRTGAAGAPAPAAAGGKHRPFEMLTGEVIDNQPPGLHFKTHDGHVLAVATADIGFLENAGHFEPDNAQPANPGGYTAMAMWALACSDMDPKDAKWKKAVEGYLKNSTPPGTYTLSFRMNTFSYLARWSKGAAMKDYLKALLADTPFMMKAMDKEGMYGYTCYPGPGLQVTQKPSDFTNTSGNWGTDNSNAQFGVFGMWAAEDAMPLESEPYWITVDKHWRDAQVADGGWGYNKGRGTSTANMTDAGMNSLYLVVDKYWSRQVGHGYEKYRGFTYLEKAAAGMDLTFAAINKGWAWLDKHPNGAGGHGGMYHEYGLQRLGLASGRKYIAGENWVDKVMRAAYRQGNVDDAPGKGALDDSAWRVMCMAFGRAPVLINKLAHGDERDWNYYFRDVAFLTDWINHETEKRFNWQIVSLGDSLHDLQDAPILMISGYKKLDFSAEEQAKLKQYLDLGGTVFLQANNNSTAFKDSAKAMFLSMYKTEGYEWGKLSPDHPIFTDHGTPSPQLLGLPIKGMSDGGRHFVFMFEGDVAGAWQMHLDKTMNELYQLMLNLRIYAAPQYEEMPTRLRAVEKIGPASKHLIVARLKHPGQSGANAILYEALAPSLSRAGVHLDVKEEVQATAENLKGVGLIHLTGHYNPKLNSDEKGALKDALAHGAFLVVDPAYAKPEFIEPARALVQDMGLQIKSINFKTDALFKDIDDLKTNHKMKGMFESGAGFSEILLDGKRVGLFSEVDITASATGQFVFNSPAIGTAAARQLWANIATVLTTPATPTTKPAEKVAEKPGLPATLPAADAKHAEARAKTHK